MNKINQNGFYIETTKVLVTGSNGLYGTAIKSLVSSLNLNGFYVFTSSNEADLSDYQQCRTLFNRHKPNFVIHLAAFVGGLFRNMEFPVDFWIKNVRINNNVLSCAHEFSVKKVVSCLSTCIFPDKTIYPIDETMIHNGPPHKSNETYAYAKRMIDTLNHAYYRQYNDIFTSIIPTNIYGPNDNFNLKDGHVIPSLIHRCFLSKKNKTDFVVYGSGRPLRQFILSSDLAELTLFVLENYNHVDPLIISVDEVDEISIKKLVGFIVNSLKFKGKVVWDSTKSDGQFKKTASNKKMRKLVPDFQFTGLKEGIQLTCDWFEKNYENARK